jgi:hypothetical protein
MSVAMTFSENATPVMRGLKQAANSKAAKQAVGMGLTRVVGDHLRAKDLEPNKQGWPKTHFYATAAQSITAPEVDGNTVSISITQTGFRQRYLGGDIDPIGGRKFLTIPGNAVGYGKRALEFDGLKFAFAQDENGELHPALVSTEAFQERGTVRNRRGMGPKPPFGPDTVVYWLYRHVHQDGDPSVLPTPEEIAAAAQQALSIYLRREARPR